MCACLGIYIFIQLFMLLKVVDEVTFEDFMAAEAANTEDGVTHIHTNKHTHEYIDNSTQSILYVIRLSYIA